MKNAECKNDGENPERFEPRRQRWELYHHLVYFYYFIILYIIILTHIYISEKLYHHLVYFYYFIILYIIILTHIYLSEKLYQLGYSLPYSFHVTIHSRLLSECPNKDTDDPLQLLYVKHCSHQRQLASGHFSGKKPNDCIRL